MVFFAMLPEFVQAFALLFSLGALLALFYIVATRWQIVRPPVATFLILVAFVSLAVSALSSRMYIPVMKNGTLVYVQDAYGLGFISSVVSTISVFVAMALFLFSVVNESRRTLAR